MTIQAGRVEVDARTGRVIIDIPGATGRRVAPRPSGQGRPGSHVVLERDLNVSISRSTGWFVTAATPPDTASKIVPVKLERGGERRESGE